MKPIIYHFTNLAPIYRKKLWITLFESKDFAFYNFFGKNRAMGIKTIDFNEEIFGEFKNRLRPLRNCWINGKYLIWQQGVIRTVLFKKMDMVIALGEFPILSNWLAAIICRVRGIKIVFMGHGIYGNEGRTKLFFRKTFYRLANAHLLYERRSKQIMISQGFAPENLHVIFNSLDYDTHKELRTTYQNLKKEDILTFFSDSLRPTIIFVGRLTKSKKLDMLIESVARLDEKGIATNLLIIGDGIQKEELKSYAAKRLNKGNFHFFGACYDENELGKYLKVADICVSPGNIGLTAIHSLSSGTPVCTHSSFENQGPEVEALEEGSTGFFFRENDIDDLVNCLNVWFLKEKRNEDEMRSACFKIIDEYYNPYYQKLVIKNLLEGNDAML